MRYYVLMIWATLLGLIAARKHCDVPTVAHATVFAHGQTGAVVPNTRILVPCHPGFEAPDADFGHPVYNCAEDDEWGALPVCTHTADVQTRIDYCADPGTPVFGGRSAEPPYTRGATLSFHCLPGFYLSGQTTWMCGTKAGVTALVAEMVIDAQNGVYWDGLALPRCLRNDSLQMCAMPAPPHLRWWEADSPLAPQACRGRVYDSCLVACDDGYDFPPDTSPFIWGQCQPDGRWNMTDDYEVPTCLINEDYCPDQGPPPHGWLDYVAGCSTTIGATCGRFGCDEGYVLRGAAVRTCSVGGVWTGAEPLCEAIGRAPFALATVNSTLDASPSFGMACALKGDVAVIGDTLGATTSLFRRTKGAWRLQETLRGAAQDGFFAQAIALDDQNSTLLVGIPANSEIVRFAGRAKLCSIALGGSHLVETILPPAGCDVEDAMFGYDVALSNNTFAISAPGCKLGGTHGRVYLRSVAALPASTQSLTAPSTNASYFGASIALANGSLLISWKERGRVGLALYTRTLSVWSLARVFDSTLFPAGYDISSLSLRAASDRTFAAVGLTALTNSTACTAQFVLVSIAGASFSARVVTATEWTPCEAPSGQCAALSRGGKCGTTVSFTSDDLLVVRSLEGEWTLALDLLNCSRASCVRVQSLYPGTITNNATTLGRCAAGDGLTFIAADTATAQALFFSPVVDGGWTEFTAWGPCSAACGGGRRSRTRTCSAPYPENGGRPCVGAAVQFADCEGMYGVEMGTVQTCDGGYDGSGFAPVDYTCQTCDGADVPISFCVKTVEKLFGSNACVDNWYAWRVDPSASSYACSTCPGRPGQGTEAEISVPVTSYCIESGARVVDSSLCDTSTRPPLQAPCWYGYTGWRQYDSNTCDPGNFCARRDGTSGTQFANKYYECQACPDSSASVMFPVDDADVLCPGHGAAVISKSCQCTLTSARIYMQFHNDPFADATVAMRIAHYGNTQSGVVASFSRSFTPVKDACHNWDMTLNDPTYDWWNAGVSLHVEYHANSCNDGQIQLLVFRVDSCVQNEAGDSACQSWGDQTNRGSLFKLEYSPGCGVDCCQLVPSRCGGYNFKFFPSGGVAYYP